MIKSMTGYGRGELQTDKKIYIAELKSVNSKYLEISVKLPNHLQQFEMEIRDTVKKDIHRGKVSVWISETTMNGLPVLFETNPTVIKFIAERLKEIAKIAEIQNTIQVRDILFFNEKIAYNDEDLNQHTLTELQKVLKIALENFQEMRLKEGQLIEKQFLNFLEDIRKEIESIEEFSKELPTYYRNKLLEKLREAGLSQELIDPTRLVLEVSLIVDKQDIQEELTRLSSHVQQFKNSFMDEKPIGKKLTFLLQEMHREATTIASKSTNLNITNSTLRIREIIEMLREQVQNVE